MMYMKNIFLSERKITSNKFYCLQIYLSKIYYLALLKGSFKLMSDDYYFKFNICFLGDVFNFISYWNRRMDHAGFTFSLTLFGISFHFNIYDTRHWDFEENNWKNTYVS